MPNYNIAHKNDGKNYVLRDNGGNIKVLSSTPPVVTENESPPYPYSYFYLMDDQEDLTMEW
jgi:hypothetical protein